MATIGTIKLGRAAVKAIRKLPRHAHLYLYFPYGDGVEPSWDLPNGEIRASWDETVRAKSSTGHKIEQKVYPTVKFFDAPAKVGRDFKRLEIGTYCDLATFQTLIGAMKPRADDGTIVLSYSHPYGEDRIVVGKLPPETDRRDSPTLSFEFSHLSIHGQGSRHDASTQMTIWTCIDLEKYATNKKPPSLWENGAREDFSTTERLTAAPDDRCSAKGCTARKDSPRIDHDDDAVGPHDAAEAAAAV